MHLSAADKHFLLFSLSGFSAELKKLAQDDPTVHLVSVDRLYQ